MTFKVTKTLNILVAINQFNANLTIHIYLHTHCCQQNIIKITQV